MSVRETILGLMHDVAQQQNKVLPPLTDNLELLDSGLDSLCLAILVAELDEELGLDPLSSATEEDMPVTIGDFIRLYEDASASLAA